MPAAGDPAGSEPEEAAEWYAEQLRAATLPEDHGPVPNFDVLLLGVGEDGHVASLFPGLPALFDERPVVAVRGAPKPPPTRLSLTLPSIRAAQEVWLVAAGADKAAAIALAIGGAGDVEVPAAGVHGRSRTLWLLDAAAAVHVRGLSRIASP
jgi:6-phosphogluconolactonase